MTALKKYFMRYMIPIYHREDSCLQELIQQNFATSLMSDSKWVKLIAALINNRLLIKKCLVKPIWDDSKPSRQLVFNEHTEYSFDYYATAMEAMVSGKPRGWYAYKEIEWLDFPRAIPGDKSGVIVTQDLAAIKQIIENAGQFALELTSDNIRLYAYFK